MSRHLQTLDTALESVLDTCKPTEALPTFYASVPEGSGPAKSSKLASAAHRVASNVVEGKETLSEALEVLNRHAEQLCSLCATHKEQQDRQVVPVPSEPPEGRYRLEVVGHAAGAVLTVALACWRRAAASAAVEVHAAAAAGAAAGQTGAGGAAQLRDRAAELLERVLDAWASALSVAMRSLQDIEPRTTASSIDAHVDAVLRVAACALAALHAAVSFVDAAPTVAGKAPPGSPFAAQPKAQLAAVAALTHQAMRLVAAVVPESTVLTARTDTHIRVLSPAARMAAAALLPFPVWRHAPTVLAFLEQANRLLPALQHATRATAPAGFRGCAAQLAEMVLRVASAGTMLSFLLTFQKPQPGDGGADVERRIASLAATGAKLVRRLDAQGYTGEMWAYVNTCMGRCVQWVHELRLHGSGRLEEPSPEQVEQMWRGMCQPDGKLAALAHVYAEVWPLAQQHRLGESFTEHWCYAAALLTNIAGLPVAERGGLRVLADDIQRVKDRINVEWLFNATCALRFAGEAQTQLYCWYARDGVLEALAAVGAALARRTLGQADTRLSGVALDYAYSITLRTARKADELAGSHCAAGLEAWLAGQYMRRPVMSEMLGQASFWRAMQRTHIPAIQAALRSVPHAGCPPPAPAAASADRDRACAWLGCSHPACLNAAGPSEAALPVLRCAGCRVAGFCSPACQRADWQRHKPACELLRAEAE